MTPLEAHRRLMQILPVRTHIMRNDDPRRHQFKTPDEHRELRAKAKELRRKGYTLIQISEALNVSKASAFNYIRRRHRGAA